MSLGGMIYSERKHKGTVELEKLGGSEGGEGREAVAVMYGIKEE